MTPLEAIGTVAASFGFAFGTSIVPVGGAVEVYLIATSALLPTLFVGPLVLASAAGSVAAKTLVYFGARKAVSHTGFLKGDRGGRLAARIEEGPWTRRAVMFSAAGLSVPPFYALALAAGAVRAPLAEFLLVTMLGQTIRFGALWAVPQLVSTFGS